MDRIDAWRNIDGRPAVFLRFGKAGFVVVSVRGVEHKIDRSAWLDLPLWIPPPLPPGGAGLVG